MIENKGIYLLMLILSLLLAACNEEAPSPTPEEMMKKKMEVTQDTAKFGIERVELPQKELQAGIDPDVPKELLDNIRIDAAERAKSVPESVRVIMARKEKWADGSMGCPVPGEVYTQMQTSGYHIVAAVGLQKFDYRAGENGRFRLCDPMRIKKPMPKQ
jgi:hypothetical protein